MFFLIRRTNICFKIRLKVDHLDCCCQLLQNSVGLMVVNPEAVGLTPAIVSLL